MATALPPTVTSDASGVATPVPTFTPVPTETPDVFPTETVAQVQVAEQVYEGGRMMWVQPAEEIWVMIVDDDGAGQWLRFRDTFVEGEDVDSDPSLVPPNGELFVPERGFG
ncbi:MAG: hypothetical protein AAF125_24065, partial [Chloroflexota bacterium]